MKCKRAASTFDNDPRIISSDLLLLWYTLYVYNYIRVMWNRVGEWAYVYEAISGREWGSNHSKVTTQGRSFCDQYEHVHPNYCRPSPIIKIRLYNVKFGRSKIDSALTTPTSLYILNMHVKISPQRFKFHGSFLIYDV